MLGHGRRVGVVQFIKGAWGTGERDALEPFGDRVVWHTMGEGFTWETQDRARDVAAAERGWARAEALMADPSIALLILDELNIALRYDYLDRPASSPPSPPAVPTCTSSSPAATPSPTSSPPPTSSPRWARPSTTSPPA